MIRCQDGSLYTGITTDIARRFSEHNSQGKKCAQYLRGKTPLRLVYSKMIRDRSTAHREEILVKGLTKREKEQFISE